MRYDHHNGSPVFSVLDLRLHASCKGSRRIYLGYKARNPWAALYLITSAPFSQDSQRLRPFTEFTFTLLSTQQHDNANTMAPKLSGCLSLFTAPPAPRIPRSPNDVTGEGSGSSRKYPYFTSGDLDSEKAIIFLGGLTNGMGAVPYVHKLSEELKVAGWRL